METFLILNGCEIRARVEESEAIILEVAAGQCTRERLVEWIREHLQTLWIQLEFRSLTGA